MPGMARGSSPTLIGRADDLERLRAALAGARELDRPVVLVSGEAGIGKSRLLAEFATSAAADPPDGRPVRFLHGGCLEVGETLAYLPILEWLDALARDGGEPGAEARLLHDQFGGSVGAAAADGDAGPGRSTRLQRLRDVIAASATDADLVAVIDDLHWADRSTLDVVSFLARRLAGSNVLLVLAFRSDELHRRHPLTPVVAELERHATLDHIRLAPLGSDDVRAQIDAIEGRAADSGEVARVVALADGNPFHVEELLALEGSGPLPDSLRDVLDARLGQVDDGTLEILREAAVIGRSVDAALLVTISSATDSAVDDAIRTAVGARILVADPDGRHYRFRHALLREAVYDEMRPVERMATHRRIAEALTARPDLGDPAPGVALAERAHHWLAARAEPEAFIALIESGRAARAAYAWAEGRQAFEEALVLWDRVPDPGSAGVARSRLLQDAAAMTWYMGETRAALSLNRQAQAEPDVQADPPRLARLLDHEAWYVWEFGDLELAQQRARMANELLPADVPTTELALARGTLGAQAQMTGRTRDAVAILEEGLAIARAAGNEGSTVTILAFLAVAYGELGDSERALAAITTAEDAMDRVGVEDAFFAVTTNGPWVRIGIGDYEGAVANSQWALTLGEQRGMDVGGGQWLTAPRAEAEYRLGRWDDALATVAGSAAYTTAPSPASTLQSVVARILAGRGDHAAARSVIDEAIRLARPQAIDESVAVRTGETWVEALGGDPAVAANGLRTSWSAWADTDGRFWRSELAWQAAWIATLLAERPGRRDGDAGDDLAAFARDAVGSVRETGAYVDGIDPNLDLAAAFLSRRAGRDDPAIWAAAGDQLERVGYLPLAAVARQGEAEAHLRAGSPASAEPSIRRALQHVDVMGASAMRAPIERLARAARIPLDQAGADDKVEGSAAAIAGPVDPWGLSIREREVLALVAEGRTNREIGEALFISDKTASVHVTHILTKLGVSSRTEAALVAARAGIVAAAPERQPG